MRTYCSLVVSSDTDHQLDVTVQRILGLTSNKVVDTQAPGRIASRKKLAKILGTSLQSPPRYFWRFTSMDMINSSDIQVHIEWLFSQVRPGTLLHEASMHGSEISLTCFWAGNGRGGGPTLTPSLMRAIADHGIEFEFDFYVEENLN
jgi:hypothetical protein